MAISKTKIKRMVKLLHEAQGISLELLESPNLKGFQEVDFRTMERILGNALEEAIILQERYAARKS